MKKVWIGHLPEICGYGVFVICKTETAAKKHLIRGYINLTEGYRKHWYGGEEYTTFKGAMEYFGGRIYSMDFNEISNEL